MLSVAPQMLANLHPSASSNPSEFEEVGSTVFFTANDGTNGPALWKTDGTAADTILVKDIFPSSTGAGPVQLTNLGGTLYFTANDGINGYELWKSDGTAAGTTLVKDMRPGNSGSTPVGLTNVEGTLYFTADDGTHGAELWKSDGTAAGTTLVKDIYPGSGLYAPSQLLVNVGGTLYFSAHDGINGYELWKSDGTAAGTTLVKDIYPGSGSSGPRYLTNVGGTLYFTANDGTNGLELWKSDGTAAGTTLVKNINPDTNPGSDSSYPINLTNVGGTLYFTAFNATHGNELWKSDGTSAGTTLVKDIYPGRTGSAPTALANIGGTLYFRANDGTHGVELWKSDGTAAGTVLVKDLLPGSVSSYPSFLTNVGGTLYFRGNDGASGAELWKSDGTPAGTTLVMDIWPGDSGSSPQSLTNVNGTLYFSANDGVHGREPWIYQVRTGLTGIALDGLNNLVISDLANGGKQDNLKISLVGGKIRIEDLNGDPLDVSIGTFVSTSAVDVDPNSFSAQIIFLAGDGDDQLTLDLSTGNPIPAAGLAYSGGVGGMDQLTIHGDGSSTTASYMPSSSTFGDGTITINGFSTVTFSGLEPVDITGMALASTVLPAGATNSLQLNAGFDSGSGVTPAIVVTGETNGTPIEAVHLYGNTAVMLDVSNATGANSISVASAIALGHANGSVTLKTTADANGSVRIGAGLAVTGALEINSPTVNLQAALSAGTLSGSATNVSVGGGSSIQAGIDIAAATATLHIAAGTYTGSITPTAKAITLSPGNCPGQVILNGDLTLDANDTLVLEIEGPNAASQYDNFIVNGTVVLGGAAMMLQVDPAYTPTFGQQFTIISNDGADAVVGTFGGMPQGVQITIGGNPYYISYTGGTGNDVVLTRAEPSPPSVVDLNGPSPGTGNTSNFTLGGSAVNITTNTATILGLGNLASMTFTITIPHANDVLAANTTGTPIVASYSAGVLTLSGTGTVAQYQQVLRTVTFATSGFVPAGSRTINVIASDGTTNSPISVATVNVSGVIVEPPFIISRRIFYNQSKFDGNDAGINASDDLAIDTSKSAYLPGSGQATFANTTSYNKGINGIMIDLGGSLGTLTAADFSFKVGANNNPSLWANAPAPIAISVRPGAGAAGSNRIEIIWANNVIQNTWLRVSMLANANTGLAAPDTFYFGNRIGNSSTDGALLVTNPSDELAARTNPGTATVTNAFDYNKDGFVTPTDQLVVRQNAGFLLRINIALPGAPAAPLAESADGQSKGSVDSSADAVASALAVPGTPSASSPQAAGWILSRLRTADLNRGPLAELFTQLAEENSPRSRQVLMAANKVTNALGLDDSLLESLLDDLGL